MKEHRDSLRNGINMPYFSVTQGAVAKGRGKGGTSMKLLAKNAPEHLHVMPCVGKWSTGVTHC